jgi:alpha,alpha-trehalase
VGIAAIIYAGSHGFDIAGPGGLRKQMGVEFLAGLDAAEKKLRDALEGVPGALIERKRFSIAAHYRNVDEHEASKVERAVSELAARHRHMRTIRGKKVFELLPGIDWDKGKAVLWLLKTLELESEAARAIYIGDDRTDEDAFRALEQCGVGIRVREQSHPTAARYSLKNPDEVGHFLRTLSANLS